MRKNMTSKISILSVVLLSAAALLLGGCGNIVSQSTPTEFYRLLEADNSQISPVKSELPDGLQVGIGPITIPGYVDRPQIVTSGTGGRLIVDDFNHWAEPVQENIERIMVANMSSLLSQKQVFHYPANFHPDPSSLQIAVEITNMIRDENGQVYLSARWNVKRMLDNRLLARDAVKYQSVQNDKDFSDYSLALSALFGKLSVAIVKSINSVSK